MTFGISIIIPVYNVKDYISVALDSVFNQSFPADEVIVVDDGSFDGTSEIISEYKKIYNFTSIKTNNRGQGQARNSGVNLARFDYIYFFDSDDILDSDFISKIRELLLRNDNPDLLFFSGETFTDEGYLGDFKPSYNRGFEGRFDSPSELIYFFNKNNSGFCSPCLYISKRCLWMAGLSFGSFYHEDEEVFYPLIFKSDVFLVVNDVFFYRRVRNNSTMTGKKTNKHLEGVFETVNSLLKLKSEVFDGSSINYISCRIRRFLVIYVGLCRELKVKPDFSFIFKVFKSNYSVVFFMKITYFYLRLDKSSKLNYLLKKISLIK